MKNYEKATSIKYSFFSKLLIWFFKNPVIIYTVGKVGSSTIANTLRERGVQEVQPHSLWYSNIGGYFVTPKASKLRKFRNISKTITIRFKTKAFLLKIRLFGPKVKIITLYRDPVARNISAFFEQFHHLSERSVVEYDITELIDMFWEYTNHSAPIDWFDLELKRVMGVDIYQHDFDKSLGFLQFEYDKYKVLVIQMEKLSKLSGEIANFVTLPSFQVSSTNRSDKKVYAEVYRQFKKEISFPRSYLDKMYDTKAVKYFYTNEMISEFYEKWS
ncbi:MAG: putative capsular polysaccharide synthesis family protein [Colwellia sp.]